MERVKARQAYFVFMFVLSVFFISGCHNGGGSIGGGGSADLVTFIVPANNTVGVPIGNKITVTFTEAMNPATINTKTFTVMDGITPVSGTVTYSGVTAVFTPAANLTASTTYTAKITTGAEDLAFNALASDYVWSFTTGATADTTAPIASLKVPGNAATGVLTNSKITVTFSEAMDPSTISTTTFTLTDGVAPVLGTVTYAGVTAVFTPATDLKASTTYTATITTGAEDLAFNALAGNYVWSFTTGATADTAAPTVTFTNPVDTAIGVILSKKVQATFSEAMDPSTISTATFTLMDGVTPVSGTVTYVGLVATFTPKSSLADSTTYTAKITTAAEDLAFNALASNYVWSFTTITKVALGPVPVDLGTAGNFVLLTKTGITNTGATAITGDIGVSPISSTAITGFGIVMDVSNQFSTTVGGPGSVIGKVYAADYAVPTPANLTTAISDIETAFVNAAGRAIPDFTELGAGNISGRTLSPGLYKWGTGVLITAAGVTISGGADDVWIFQIAGDLTVNPGAIVTLAGGAQAKNIFWQVNGGVGVTFDTGAAFQGIILASKAIIFKTGATLNGRALAQTAVTLDANTITEP